MYIGKKAASKPLYNYKWMCEKLKITTKYTFYTLKFKITHLLSGYFLYVLPRPSNVQLQVTTEESICSANLIMSKNV